MSTQQTEKQGAQALGAEAVEHYLRSHPEFFLEHEALLLEIALPHPSGAAVSLVERQVALLREQNRRYRRQLQELMEIARGNDELLGRLQQLALGIMDSGGLAHTLAALEASLQADFGADAASLQIFGAESVRLPAAPQGFLRVSVRPPDAVSEDLHRLLAGAGPVCGRLKNERLVELFGERADTIGSAALLPLAVAGRTLGVLAIGSHGSERFNAEMGTTYLRYLAELIAHRLASFVPMPAPALPA